MPGHISPCGSVARPCTLTVRVLRRAFFPTTVRHAKRDPHLPALLHEPDDGEGVRRRQSLPLSAVRRRLRRQDADCRWRPAPAASCGRRSAPLYAWLILLGLAGLGLLLLTGAGLALAVHFLPRREGPPVAAAPAPTPPAPEADPLAQPPTPDVPVPISDKNDPPRQNPRPSDLPAAQPPELAPPEQSVLEPEEQEKVNKAIDRGVAWLKKTQLSDGELGAGPRRRSGRLARPDAAGMRRPGRRAARPKGRRVRAPRRPDPGRDLRAGPGHPVPGPPRRSEG